MKTSLIFFILISLSFLFSLNITAQVSHNPEQAEKAIDRVPRELNLDINEIPVSETNVIRYFEVDKVEKSDIYYVYEYYDKNGNSVTSLEPPTKEYRYECPICKGERVLQVSKNNHKTCWRCNGSGYVVSNPGK
jgi:hypothetical protein